MGQFSLAKLFGITIRESANDGSDFTNPDADYRRLFLGEDGQLHVKDSSGTVTDIGGAVSDIVDLPTAETDDTLVLAPDGAGGVEFRAEAGGSFDPDTHMPWTIDINPYLAKSNTNWSTITSDTALNGYIMQSSGAQNAERSWDIVLAAGTWEVAVIYRRTTASGIASVRLDGSDVGTIDFYGSLDTNDIGTATGISVGTTGKKVFSLKMATKNGSSSSYVGNIMEIQWRRTA